MKLKEFEKVQELIKKYHNLKNHIDGVKRSLNLREIERVLYINGISPFFNGFPLTKEETNMILSRLESKLFILKVQIKELGVEIDNDK